MNTKFKSKPYLTPKQAAEYLNVSTETIRVWTNKGCLKYVATLGGHRRFKLEDLLEFAEYVSAKGVNIPSNQTKVLIIEDDKQSARYLKECISNFSRNYVVDIASDGFEAGYKTVSFLPDVVLLDLVMPDISGIKISRLIKENPITAHAKIISITGNNSKINEANMLASGAHAILIKPVNENILRQLIENEVESDRLLSAK